VPISAIKICFDKAPSAGRKRKENKVFVEGISSYVTAYADLLDEYRDRYSQLLGVYDVPPGPPVMNGEQLFELAGIKGWVPQSIEIVDGQVGNASEIDRNQYGAMFYIAKNDAGEVRPVLFIKKGLPRPGVPGRRHEAAVVLALIHEVGHVDDFTSGTVTVLGKPADMIAAELHAHTFACNEMVKHDFGLALWIYVEKAIPQYAGSEVAAVREPAVQFMVSSDFARFKKIAAEHDPRPKSKK
jgi:hypothetical protein